MTPMENACAAALGRMALMKYFPSDPFARAALMDELASMCPSPEAVLWLSRRVVQMYAEWPGVREVRAMLCSKFRPADGVSVFSEVYEDGIPSERESMPALPAPERLMIAERREKREIAAQDAAAWEPFKAFEPRISAPKSRPQREVKQPEGPPLTAEQRAELVRQIEAAERARGQR